MEAIAQLSSLFNSVKSFLPFSWIHDQLSRMPIREELNMRVAHTLTVPSTLSTTSLRNESFALLAHDIKNALNVLFGEIEFLEEILQIRGSQYEKGLLTHVKNDMVAMCTLLAHYQDVEFGTREDGLIRCCPVVLSSVLQRVEQRFALEAKRRDIEMTFVLHDTPLMVDGDAIALERVFANLVHNALKFTPDGGHVTVVAVDYNRTEVIVTVSDTGPGIAPEELPLLFRKYQRTEAGKASGGDGLGLFIVKTFVEAHGGRVSVDSGDCWTSFMVVLPCTPPQEPQPVSVV